MNRRMIAATNTIIDKTFDCLVKSKSALHRLLSLILISFWRYIECYIDKIDKCKCAI